MNKQSNINRREFLSRTAIMGGLGCCLVPNSIHSIFLSEKDYPIIPSGTKQIFVDDLMLEYKRDAYRMVHPASKLDKPVLEADMPWEQGEEYDGKRDRRIYIYGTVLRDERDGTFRMWYSRRRDLLYAVSNDGIHWTRPNLGLSGETNIIPFFEVHSPSIILDKKELDPSKCYKAVGSTKNGYYAAFSADGLHWSLYPDNPIVKDRDTITLSQDPVTGEYLIFHKVQDSRVVGRQVFLSVSKDMKTWSYSEPVMVTDETDHAEARKLPGGTHAEFYSMSAFPYGNQWLGFVPLFRRTGEPSTIKHKKGTAQSYSEGPLDIRLVHSRDGRTWSRCSDRSPVIPLGPYPYDSGSILGLCNSPVIVGDEMWLYYTAITTTHGGALPDKEMSIARASWRIDGTVSLRADASGEIATKPFIARGDKLMLNADASKGQLTVEILDKNGKIMKGYSEKECKVLRSDSVNHRVQWANKDIIPINQPISLRFRLKNGNLYSYTIG